MEDVLMYAIGIVAGFFLTGTVQSRTLNSLFINGALSAICFAVLYKMCYP